MSGYTHGIMTVRVPQEVAQAIHKNARDLGVDPTELIQRVLWHLADVGFAEIWADECRPVKQDPA